MQPAPSPNNLGAEVPSGDASASSPTPTNATGLRALINRFLFALKNPAPRPATGDAPQAPWKLNDVRPDIREVPPLTARARKELPDVAALGEETVALKRGRYAPPSGFDKPIELPKNFTPRPLALVIISEAAITPVARLHQDVLRLLSSLFDVLRAKYDPAAAVLHGLRRGSKIPLVAKKSTVFIGWILADTEQPSLAAILFTKGLAMPGAGEDATAATEDLRYATGALESLSRLGHKTRAAKHWLASLPLATLAERFTAPDASGFLALALAEQALEQGKFEVARRHAQSVPAKTGWKEQARYLAAVATLAGAGGGAAKGDGINRQALETAGRELTDLFRIAEDQQVFDATAAALGRIHFMLGNYKASHLYLSQTSRESNLWVDAAVDNAWAMFRAGDRNHAVGNMFTLHTPYFDGAYMPESYFVKSLGYQELCQFGDAATAVRQYKMKYANVFRGLLDFNGGGKTPEDAYYKDLVAYLSQGDHRLPGMVLRELGRHPDFLKRQGAINQLSQETRKLPAALPTAAPGLAAEGTKPLEELRTRYQREISRFLKTKALAMEQELKFLTANISLLEYEIFAGASRNLALQGAQNFAVDPGAGQKNAGPKKDFEEGKEYWPYEDELWEDELNHFRSKIVDGCARVAERKT